MLCETCRWSGRPGFVLAHSIPVHHGPAHHVGAHHVGARHGRHHSGAAGAMIPCPECGGCGIAHCCEGMCDEPAPVTGACGSAQPGTVP